ncbi:ATP-binding protein [Paenibacillus radicis (ex Gao et al. 2016)]|uniref:histidine kinase n=1 Tax=Paenibacillus radicis (ex Gao et al. 2016) TaxID=1737354 RepID=A0A917LXW4_9BACL|nr:ATP-binding protein [Paenibacillus radicis (ex Gao et al. 2016)]GGG66107.1 hypothetical protein GCM10010918_20610 [Paenibacillus radicis (ex Gao et al. 2016)]
MNHDPTIGKFYYMLLSLLIIVFACYTMFSMVGQPRTKQRFSLKNWIVGGSLVLGLGLWTMHVVSMLGSDYLIVLDMKMLYALIGCSALTYFGIMNLWSKCALNIRLLTSSIYISVGAAALHYVTMLSGEIRNCEVDYPLLILSFIIIYLGTFFSLYLFMLKRQTYKMISSAVLGASAMALHQIGLMALKIEHVEVVTTDRLNNYLLLLAFLLGIATLLIFSFTFTTWYAARKYNEMNVQYKLLVENSLDMIAMIKNNKWTFINKAGLRMFEAKQADELIGKPVRQFLHVKHHEQLSRWLHDEESEPNEVQQKPMELEWQTVKGTQLYTEIVRSSTSLSGEWIIQVIIRDISERKKNEELMINSEKLYIAGQLAAGIAHEIRNPLTSLKGFLQLITTGRADNRNYYDIMKSELVRIEAIVSELLMLSKPQVYDLAEQDIRKMLSETVALLETEAILHNIEMVLQMDQQPLWVMGVENQIKQVFINVIKNAIEVMAHGGRITILADLEEGRTVTVSIHDEGPGMEKEQLSKIGQPFYTTKEKGTGLGMMVTYKIVDNHHGQINAYSQTGEGTTFYIRFPSSRAQPVLPAIS